MSQYIYIYIYLNMPLHIKTFWELCNVDFFFIGNGRRWDSDAFDLALLLISSCWLITSFKSSNCQWGVFSNIYIYIQHASHVHRYFESIATFSLFFFKWVGWDSNTGPFIWWSGFDTCWTSYVKAYTWYFWLAPPSPSLTPTNKQTSSFLPQSLRLWFGALGEDSSCW